jgi:DNA-binding XRE family transcriptional regulator
MIMVMTLKEHRERAYLTTRELAKKAGVAAPTLWRIETGQNKPHISTMRKIAKALKVKPEDIAEFAPIPSTGA